MDRTTAEFEKLLKIIKKLRGPDGCPWDLEQTPSTLKPHLIEEVYECIDAITKGDSEEIKEELGDLYLLASMIAYMKEQDNSFTIESVFKGINEKLVRRHPHIFSDILLDSSEDVIKQWDDIKRTEKKNNTLNSLMETISKTLPPLERSLHLQKAASKKGFDWIETSQVWIKLEEEIEELKAAISEENDAAIEEEFGDILFSMVNLSRFLKVDPLLALHGANNKFIKRFSKIEKDAEKQGRQVNDLSFDEMEDLWIKSKISEG